MVLGITAEECRHHNPGVMKYATPENAQDDILVHAEKAIRKAARRQGCIADVSMSAIKKKWYSDEQPAEIWGIKAMQDAIKTLKKAGFICGSKVSLETVGVSEANEVWDSYLRVRW